MCGVLFCLLFLVYFVFSSRRRHTSCALVAGVQTCALPICHRAGTLDAGHDLESTSYPRWTLSRAEVTRLAEEGGCVAPTGPAGSAIGRSSSRERVCQYV